MIVILYAVEAVLALWAAAVVAGAGLWIYRACVDMPLWLLAVGAGAGLVIRLWRQWSPLGWVVTWHGALRRRIEER